jgi:hypothetical protein
MSELSLKSSQQPSHSRLVGTSTVVGAGGGQKGVQRAPLSSECGTCKTVESRPDNGLGFEVKVLNTFEDSGVAQPVS